MHGEVLNVISIPLRFVILASCDLPARQLATSFVTISSFNFCCLVALGLVSTLIASFIVATPFDSSTSFPSTPLSQW